MKSARKRGNCITPLKSPWKTCLSPFVRPCKILIALSNRPLGGISNWNAARVQTSKCSLVHERASLYFLLIVFCSLFLFAAAAGSYSEECEHAASCCLFGSVSEAVVRKAVTLDKICCQEHDQSVHVWLCYATPYWFKEHVFDSWGSPTHT